MPTINAHANAPSDNIEHDLRSGAPAPDAQGKTQELVQIAITAENLDQIPREAIIAGIHELAQLILQEGHQGSAGVSCGGHPSEGLSSHL